MWRQCSNQLNFHMLFLYMLGLTIADTCFWQLIQLPVQLPLKLFLFCSFFMNTRHNFTQQTVLASHVLRTLMPARSCTAQRNALLHNTLRSSASAKSSCSWSTPILPASWVGMISSSPLRRPSSTHWTAGCDTTPINGAVTWANFSTAFDSRWWPWRCWPDSTRLIHSSGIIRRVRSRSIEPWGTTCGRRKDYKLPVRWDPEWRPGERRVYCVPSVERMASLQL